MLVCCTYSENMFYTGFTVPSDVASMSTLAERVALKGHPDVRAASKPNKMPGRPPQYAPTPAS